jgi:hypothetical protein
MNVAIESRDVVQYGTKKRFPSGTSPMNQAGAKESVGDDVNQSAVKAT